MEKSVALNIFSNDGIKVKDEMAYITRRFQKIIKNHRGFQIKGSTNRETHGNDLCKWRGNFIGTVQARSRKLRTLNF